MEKKERVDQTLWRTSPVAFLAFLPRQPGQGIGTGSKHTVQHAAWIYIYLVHCLVTSFIVIVVFLLPSALALEMTNAFAERS